MVKLSRKRAITAYRKRSCYDDGHGSAKKANSSHDYPAPKVQLSYNTPNSLKIVFQPVGRPIKALKNTRAGVKVPRDINVFYAGSHKDASKQQFRGRSLSAVSQALPRRR